MAITSLTKTNTFVAGTTAEAAKVNANFDELVSKVNEVVALVGGVTSSTAELNILDGVTATAAELNILDGVTSTAAELNILDGVTATAAEINVLAGIPGTLTATEVGYLDGVTSAIQTQLNAKSPVISSATTSATGVVELATSAEMVTGTDTGRVPSVSVVKAHPGVAKFWCVFDGTATGTNAPTSGYNVTSVTRNSAGNYTVNLTVAFSSANYAVTASSSPTTGAARNEACGAVPATASTVTITIEESTGDASDGAVISCIGFGDQ